MKYLFVVDVDGVLTDGGFYYSQRGKVLKKFGPDDSDAIKELQRRVHVIFVSADLRGFKISKKRIVKDMNMPLYYHPPKDRIKWARSSFNAETLAYMGDSYKDIDNFKNSDISIAPADANQTLKESADFVTNSPAGRRALSEGCFFLNTTWNLALDLPTR